MAARKSRRKRSSDCILTFQFYIQYNRKNDTHTAILFISHHCSRNMLRDSRDGIHNVLMRKISHDPICVFEIAIRPQYNITTMTSKR